MSTEKTPWTARLDFAMLTTWLLLSLVLAIIAFLWFGQDFRGYYAAARVLIAGGNPYDYHQVSPVLLELTGEMGNNPYYYPPWFAWLFVPLLILPFQVARAAWMILNVIMWSMGLWQLGKLISWPPMGWRRYALFALTTFSFAWITWRYEQAGILVFVICIALILSIERQNWVWSGVLLALLLVKPNITLLVVAGLSLWLLLNRQWRPILVMVLSLIILLSLSTIITPDWFQPFTEEGFGRGLTVALDGPDQVVALRINTTFLDWLRVLGVEAGWRTWIYGIALGLGAFLFFRSVSRSRSLLELISILLLISYAITPYALQYDYPPLVIPLFWGLSRLASSQKTLAVGLALAGFVFSVIFWQQNISWAYWMVMGLATLILFAATRKENYSEERSGISRSS